MGNYKSNKKLSGFSLVEMAVVLVIAGLILGTVISAMNTQVTGQRLKSNIERQQVIKQALTNYIARNFHLPCPADPTDQTSPGQSQPSGAACLNVLTTTGTAPAVAYVGAVPWLDLGLSEAIATDAYGRRFTYAVTYSAVGLNLDTVSGMTGNMVIYETARPALANPLNNCTGTSPCEKFAVAVIVSHGANGFGAYYGATTAIGMTGATLHEIANADNADLSFVARDYSQSGSDAYDDAVLWLKPDDLLGPLIESNVIKHATGFTMSEIDKAKVAQVIASKVAVACPVGTPTTPGYQITAMTNAALTYTDAWGQTLKMSAAGSTVCTSSTTTAFSVASSGIDQTLGTADDLVVNISEAEVLSIASRLGM